MNGDRWLVMTGMFLAGAIVGLMFLILPMTPTENAVVVVIYVGIGAICFRMYRAEKRRDFNPEA